MEWLAEVWRRLLFPFRRRQFDRDLEEEMRFHLEMQAQELGPAAARRRFGNATLLLEDSRQAWGWAAVDSWLDDLRYAARVLRKNLGFTAVAVVTLALGIGATTAVFSVVYTVLFRPLPFRAPDQLAMVWQTHEMWGDRANVSLENFREWERQSRSFEGLAAFAGDSARMTVGDEPVTIMAGRVRDGFFRVLGVQPALGRTFLPEDARPGAPKTTVLSYSFWQRLGGDPKLVGRTVQLDRDVLTVVGVMPKGFAFPAEKELWFPLPDSQSDDHGHYLWVVGRLKAGVSMSQAHSEMQTIAARLRQANPAENSGIGANVVPLTQQIVGEARRASMVLMGAVACLLLIACANVANLLLVRATSRRREIALRLALGASRWRIVRCLLTESALLSFGGALAGVAAAHGLVRGFVALDPIHLPRIQEVAVDGPVLLFALAAALGTGIVFGLAPALRVSRPDVGHGLKEGPEAAGTGGLGRFGRNRGRSTLAVAQISLALMLLVSASLFLRSFVMRVSVPLGFRPEGVLAAELPWSVHGHVDELLERLRALPGVLTAGAATAFPQNSAGTSCGGCLEIEGQPKHVGKQYVTGQMVATPGFLDAAGMTVRQGRFFTLADGAQAPGVAVINEALARRDFPGQDPIGRKVRWGTPAWSTIVGVAGNVKGFGVAGDPMPAIYFPHQQASWGNGVQVLIRTGVPPLSLAPTVRAQMRAWNRRMIIGKFDSLDNLLASTVAVPRFYLILLVGFAVLALAISAVGVYGTINYSVAMRTHEIGIRMALGAERGDVLAMILRQGLALTAAGVVAGLAGAWLATRALETLLFGIRPGDGVSFACGSGVLVLTVLLAALIPARRATRVDPMAALRCE
jgi:predicted permease